MALIELETIQQLEDAIKQIGDKERYIIVASRRWEIYVLPTKSTKTLYSMYYKAHNEPTYIEAITKIIPLGYKVLYAKRVFFDDSKFMWSKGVDDEYNP